MGGMDGKKKEIREQEKLSLGKDLLYSLPAAILGGAIGGLYSFVHPLFIPTMIKSIREKGIKELRDFVGIFAAFGVYSWSMYGIIKDIVEQPDNPLNYIPVATNLLSGMGQAIYKIGKEEGLKQKSKELSDKVGGKE